MTEEQVKEIIEQVGYQEFYRYFQEKTTYIDQQRKEIERLNKDFTTLKELQMKTNEENNRLHSIIKEVREYIKNMKIWDIEQEYDMGKLLGILNKAEENK